MIDGPPSDLQLTERVTIDVGALSTQPSASVTAAACPGPEAPAATFTFTATPSVTTAELGDTIEYVYCGQNTGDVPLEVLRLVDDRLGVVIELTDRRDGGEPGGSLCNTDLGEIVTTR